MPLNLKHILVIRLSAMGDVAIAFPVILALRQQYPELKITILTRPFFKPIFNSIDNVAFIEPDLKGKHKGLLGLYKLSKEIKNIQPDAIADFHGVLRTHILKFFCGGIPFKQIDKGRNEKKKLIKGEIFTQLKPSYQRYADVLSSLGLKVDFNRLPLPGPQQLSEELKKELNTNSPLIGIAPFAAFEGKTYPIDKMKEVISNLSSSGNIILFGGPSEKHILEELEKDGPNTISIAGKFDFETELKLISNLDLMISMDSGNAHLAANYGVDVITIWGVTHPFAGFYPFNQNMENALLADKEKFPAIPTSIYGNKFPEGYEKAIESISVEEILGKAREILRKNS